MHAKELRRALLDKEVDAIIAPVFDESLNESCNFLTIREERMLLAVSKHHPLAKHDEVSLDDLRGEKFFVPNRKIWPVVTAHLDSLLGFMPEYRRGRELDDAQTLMAGIEQDMGIALVLDHNRSIYGDRVRFIKLREEDETGFSVKLELAWLKEAEEAHGTAASIAHLKRVIRAL